MVILGSEDEKDVRSESVQSSRSRAKHTPHTNYHQSENCHKLGDTVTARIGDKYKKPGGKNHVKLPVYGKIIESKGNNEYVVNFVNGDILNMKSNQLKKGEKGVTFDQMLLTLMIAKKKTKLSMLQMKTKLAMLMMIHRPLPLPVIE